MNNLAHAHDALARGLRVFPQEGKRPKIRQWPQNATDKPSVAERWWARWPNADIGIALTPDLYVLDTDSGDALAAVGLLDLPRTLTVTTARGAHYYFRVPHQLARMPGGGAGLRAIEGKGSPGPVTWAGSRHASGLVYEIEVDAPIANMPRPLVDAIGPKRSQQRAGEATPTELEDWRGRAYRVAAHINAGDQLCIELVVDAAADQRLALAALRCELPNMPSGWADRLFRAGAYLGPHVASGALTYYDVKEGLDTVFYDLDTDGGDPGHALRSIERGIALGAREAGL